MTTVYVITSGSYSDYGINRVYLDKAEAEAFVALYNKRHRDSDSMEIEVWESSDGSNVDDAPESKEGFIVSKYPDSSLYVMARTLRDDHPPMTVYSLPSYRGEYLCIDIPFDRAKDDPDVARKIAQDRFAQHRAEQVGIA